MEFTEMQAQEAARSAGIDLEKERFDLKALTAGMNAELEHGTASPDTNITNDDPVMTAKLAAAHLRVSPFYYASGRGLKAWEASLRRGVKTKSSKTEHKTLSFRTEEYDEESGIFSGYAAVYGNIDSGGDIIEPGAFTKTIAEGWERVKILALHNDCWLPIGRPLELREDSNGLFIKAKISDTSMGRDIKVLLKDGVLNELSIGYDPIVFDYDENGIRHLREVKLWEVSVVTWAMNPEATITDYKQATDAAGFLDAFLEAAVSEVKAGRKISGTRLKALKDASASMKAATKVLDGTEAELGAGEEDHRKLYFGRTQNKSLAVTNRRSIVIYGDQDEEYPDAAYVGNVGPFYPESVTWKFKRPQGLTVPDLTAAERDALEEANVNFLTAEYKREYLKNGVCADGEFIDVQMGADYIAKTMRENLYDIFLENAKVGYTDAGFATIATGVYRALNRAVELGIIATDPESNQGIYTVVVPRREDATDAQARNRQMPDITWEAQLEGAVHSIKVKGTLRATLSA